MCIYIYISQLHEMMNRWILLQLGTTPVTTSHSYQPSPMYQQPRMRFPQPGVRQPGQFTQQQLQLQQRSKLIQQQQQQHQQEQMKQRLLQQQKQQQMVIPSNATATDQINSSIHNIDNLLNNTVAPPNVSLQVYTYMQFITKFIHILFIYK